MTCSRKWRNSSTDTRATYASWWDMRDRCTNPENPLFQHYGARGITVCARWLESYDAFYADMGPRRAGMRLERVDNDQGYDPFNCVWATQAQQLRNTRRTRMITLAGRTQPMEDWASEIGIDPTTLAYRLRKGFPEHRMLAPPSATHQNFRGRV